MTGCSDAFYPFYANASTKVTNKEEALRPNRSFWRHVRLDDREALNLVGGRVSCLPEALRQRYLRFQTAFDYNQEDLIQMSRDRAPFVDQSQSHSLFLREEDAARASTLANLIALMPTSGCAQVTGCSDAFYPFYATSPTAPSPGRATLSHPTWRGGSR